MHLRGTYFVLQCISDFLLVLLELLISVLVSAGALGFTSAEVFTDVSGIAPLESEHEETSVILTLCASGWTKLIKEMLCSSAGTCKTG
jgi:hypothetical protein